MRGWRGWMLAGMLLAGPALAEDRFPAALKPADREWLTQFDAVRAEAIAAAQRGGAGQDVTVLNAVLAGEADSLPPARLVGRWRCRVLRLGGPMPLVVYPEFRCRITSTPAGLRLTKPTGSQHMAGTIYETGQARLGYAGADSAGGRKAGAYGQDPARDEVGYLIPVTPRRLRLELPLPREESRFDILSLWR